MHHRPEKADCETSELEKGRTPFRRGAASAKKSAAPRRVEGRREFRTPQPKEMLDRPPGGAWRRVVDRSVTSPTEVVVVGHTDDPGAQALLDAAWSSYGGNRTVAGGAPDGLPDTPLFAGREALGGRPTAYVCQGYACRTPVTEPDAVQTALEGPPEDLA